MSDLGSFSPANDPSFDRVGLCHVCVHRRDKGAVNTCAAYPDGDGIPKRILAGITDHTVPQPGDHGIQFERRT